MIRQNYIDNFYVKWTYILYVKKAARNQVGILDVPHSYQIVVYSKNLCK